MFQHHTKTLPINLTDRVKQWLKGSYQKATCYPIEDSNHGTHKSPTAKDGTPRYTAEVRLKGYPTQTATFKRKTDANKWTQDVESAIREGRHFKTAEAKKHTFTDLANRYYSEILPNYNEKGTKRA